MKKNNKKFSFIRYSNCWEDTKILIDALEINEGDVGLSVASAGDNTLAMLTKNPQKIYAFDVNKTQLFCFELKICCFKSLDYEEMLRFLGVGKCDRVRVFGKLAPLLSVEAREYFEKNMKLIKKGIIHTGKFERAFHIFRALVIPMICGTKRFCKFAGMENIDEQWEYYKKYIDNRRMKFLFKVFFGYKVLGRLGRDKSFYEYVEEKKESGADLKKRFEFGIKNTSNKFNPYFSYIVKKTYSEYALPLYLRKENFEIIKRNTEKITLVHGDLSVIEESAYDFINLSDIFEYMSDEEFGKSIDMVSRAAKPGARMVYWNMQNKRYVTGSTVVLDGDKSKELFKKNNSWFYRDFLIYRKVRKDEQNS